MGPEAGGEGAPVNVVEWVRESPGRVLCIVYCECAVRGRATLRQFSSSLLSLAMGTGAAYNSGCIGLRSVPITFVSGNWFAVVGFRNCLNITEMRKEVKRTKFNSPHPSPSADIKHVMQATLKIFDWRVEELAAES